MFELELCGMLCNCPACQKDGKAALVKIEDSDAEEHHDEAQAASSTGGGSLFLRPKSKAK